MQAKPKTIWEKAIPLQEALRRNAEKLATQQKEQANDIPLQPAVLVQAV